MSWKVYSAYKYKGSIQRLRKDLEKLREQHRAFVFKDRADSYLRCLTDKGKEIMKNKWLDIHDSVMAVNDQCPMRDMERMIPTAHWQLNVKGWVSVVVRPSGIYLMFGVDHEVEEWAKKNMPIEDYHWQNQCDRPDDISGREWGERERFWKGVFKDGISTAQDAGMVFNLHNFSLCHALVKEILHRLDPEKYKEGGKYD